MLDFIFPIKLQNLFNRFDLSLSFEESIFGGKKDIDVTRFEACSNCNGTGAMSSSSINSCSECRGRGSVMKSQRTPFGVISQVTSIPKLRFRFVHSFGVFL